MGGQRGRRGERGANTPRDNGVAGCGEEADVSYRVWIRSWVLREEVFDDRNGAELFRLKLEASCPTLSPSDVLVVPDQSASVGPRAPQGVAQVHL